MNSRKTLKGVVHVHTDLSHDGVFSLERLKQFFKGRGFNFVCLTDHSQDVSPEQYESLKARAGELADDDFVFVVGLEYSCDEEIHIMGLGLETVTDLTEHGPVIDHIHENNGMAILAHPTKIKNGLQDAWIRKLDGAEIWNQRADGRVLPQVKTIKMFRYLKKINPKLLAFFGADFHGTGRYQNLVISVKDCECELKAIVKALKAGRYECTSRLLTVAPEPGISPFGVRVIGAVKGVMNILKALRKKVTGE